MPFVLLSDQFALALLILLGLITIAIAIVGVRVRRALSEPPSTREVTLAFYDTIKRHIEATSGPTDSDPAPLFHKPVPPGQALSDTFKSKQD